MKNRYLVAYNANIGFMNMLDTMIIQSNLNISEELIIQCKNALNKEKGYLMSTITVLAITRLEKEELDDTL